MEGRDRGKNSRGRNPPPPPSSSCLTMHQPWASLLVHGIKRIEGRSWPSPIRGRLWIHAAGKVPDAATIEAMEHFYTEIYAVNGITDLKFPQNYPVSKLIGCIDVVGCLRREELACWNEVPEGVRLEALTDFCWLCEQPQKLVVPIEMRGYHGVYNLERKMYEDAVGNLVPVESSLPVKFRLPNPRDPFSLKPGSLSACFPESKGPEVKKSPRLSAAIAAASAAATQFSKKGQNAVTQFSNKGQNSEANGFRSKNMKNSTRQWQMKSVVANEVSTLVHRNNEQISHSENEGNSSDHKQFPHAKPSHHPGPCPKIFDAAVKGLRHVVISDDSVKSES